MSIDTFRLTRRRLFELSALAGAGIALGCSPRQEAEGGLDTLLVAQATLFTSLDQQFTFVHETQESQVNTGATLIRNRYVEDEESGLMRQDVSGGPDAFEPVLAESFEVSEDGRQYTFRLRQGVVSPAGNELTADDVIYSWERTFGIQSIPAFLAGIAMDVTSPEQVTKVDDYTVRFQLARPYDSFLHGISTHIMAPIEDSQLLLEHATDDDPWSTEFAGVNTHGFGPYSVESFEQGREAIFVANENYALGPPPISRMIWRVVPESSSRLSLLENGDVHIAKELLARELEQAEAHEELMAPRILTNMGTQIPIPCALEPFDDPRVHQAFMYAIPYDDIIERVYRGRARRMYGPVWERTTGAAPEHWHQYETDLDRAAELLEEAGVGTGFEATLAYSLAQPDAEEVAILVRDSLAQIGGRLTLRGLTPTEVSDIQGNPEGHPFPRIFRDFAIVPTPGYSLQLFFTPDNPVNWARYEPPYGRSGEFFEQVQRAVDAGSDDDPEAQAAWDQAQAALAEDSPWAYVCWVDPPHAFTDQVTGYAHRTDNTLDYSLISSA